MGKRKHKNKEYSKDENLNNQNPMDFINNNKNLNPLEIINYLGLKNNSNNLNTNELIKMLISSKLGGNTPNLPNLNTDGIDMKDISKLSESLGGVNNPKDLLNRLISNKLNLDNNNNNNNNEKIKKRTKSRGKDLDNLEFLQSLREIVDPSKIELIDKIIVMYENGEI